MWRRGETALAGWSVSRGEPFDLPEQAVEEFRPVLLAPLTGMVALALQGRFELDVRAEVRASLTSALHPALEFDGTCAEAIPEHPSVGLLAEPCHGRCLEGSGEFRHLAIESIDLAADGFVLIGHGAVGDLRVDEGHLHRTVTEKSGNRLEPHASVDGDRKSV